MTPESVPEPGTVRATDFRASDWGEGSDSCVWEGCDADPVDTHEITTARPRPGSVGRLRPRPRPYVDLVLPLCRQHLLVAQEGPLEVRVVLRQPGPVVEARLGPPMGPRVAIPADIFDRPRRDDL